MTQAQDISEPGAWSDVLSIGCLIEVETSDGQPSDIRHQTLALLFLLISMLSVNREPCVKTMVIQKM